MPKMRPGSLVLFLVLAALLVSCAKKEPQVEFRPLQLRWFAAPGQDEASMPNKDNCVIRLTSRLMGEPPVQESPVGELEYRVTYGKSPESPAILEFSGVCEDRTLFNSPECRWTATCDESLNIVVKFHNGD